MGKRHKRRRRELDPEQAYRQRMLERVLGRWLIPPPNPPEFGFERPELRVQSPLVTGTVLFDDPFHTVLPPPPFGASDPCYPAWVGVVEAAEARINACPRGKESPACDAAREAYYEASRQYANCMDLHYGKQRFQGVNNDKKNRT